MIPGEGICTDCGKNAPIGEYWCAECAFNHIESARKGYPNVTRDDLKLGILHCVDNYYVSNEGTKLKPNFHVWVPGITHSTCDSAYSDL